MAFSAGKGGLLVTGVRPGTWLLHCDSKGQVTQAVFVFTNMLRKLLKDERPEYIAAVFDTDVPTFRPTPVS